MKKKMMIAMMTALGAGITAGANADLLAYYGDGTLVDGAALANIAPVNTNITVSDLDDLGAQTGDATRITRDGFATPSPAGPTAGSASGSEWFEARSSENQGAPSSTDNYFFFTVDAEPGFTLDLDVLSYDFWISSGSGVNAAATAQAFVSVDGGAFNAFGTAAASSDDGQLATVSPVGTANVDLSSITGASSIEVRIGVGYSAGNSSSVSGFLQGIQLEGDVVPEPSSLALLGLGGLAIARRRRG